MADNLSILGKQMQVTIDKLRQGNNTRADQFAMAALPVVIQHYHFQDPDAAYRIDPIPDGTLVLIANDAMKLGKLMAEWVPKAE